MPFARAALFMGVLGLSFACSDQPTTSNSETGAAKIEINDAWARETSPEARNGSAYVEITNTGTSGDKVIGVLAEVSERSEIHNHVHKDGVMKMVHVDALDLEPGITHQFKPGGLHIMLMNLEGPLTAGDIIVVTFDFETHPDLTVEVPVLSMDEVIKRAN